MQVMFIVEHMYLIDRDETINGFTGGLVRFNRNKDFSIMRRINI